MNDQTLSPAFARFFSAPLAQTDPEIAAILGAELARQQDGIELIASENIVSAAVMQAQAFVDVPFIPLGQILPPTVYRRSVTDVLHGYALFWNLRKA